MKHRVEQILATRTTREARVRLESSACEASRVAAMQIEPLHLLAALLRDPDFTVAAMLAGVGVGAAALLDALGLDASRAAAVGRDGPIFSRRTLDALLAADAIGDRRMDGAPIDPASLLCAAYASVGQRSSIALLRMRGLPAPDDLVEIESARRRRVGGRAAPALGHGAAEAVRPAGLDHERGGDDVLRRIGVDLVASARDGRLGPVFGRTREVEQLAVALARRQKCNPVLVGEPGVGKTAVVEGLAIAIAEGRAPEALCDCRVISIDMVALRSGRGDALERFRRMIAEAAAERDRTILFIDELHTVMRADERLDLANALKPALARGDVRLIGATTFDEYRRFIEKDGALERRFDRIVVREPSADETLDMLHVVAPQLAAMHGVRICERALRACVRFGGRFLPAMRDPDRSLSILDSACAKVKLSRSAPPRPLAEAEERLRLLEGRLVGARGEDVGPLRAECDRVRHRHGELERRWRTERELVDRIDAARAGSDTDGEAELREELVALQAGGRFVHLEVDRAAIAEIVAEMSSTSPGRIDASMGGSQELFETRLAERIAGQAEATRILGRVLADAERDLVPRDRPRAVLLLAGPPGVGKSEAAATIAALWGDGDGQPVVLRMTEFSERHTVSRLKGAPPGYVGYDDGGELTEAARRRPHAVFVLDEIEKAHAEVLMTFHQVLDKGKLTDGRGRTVDFCNAIFVMTTNVGAPEIAALAPPGAVADADALLAATSGALRDALPGSLLDRMTVVPFVPLDRAALRAIAERKLAGLVAQAGETHRVELVLPDDAAARVVAALPEGATSGRAVLREIERTWSPRMTTAIGDAIEQGCARAEVPVDPAASQIGAVP